MKITLKALLGSTALFLSLASPAYAQDAQPQAAEETAAPGDGSEITVIGSRGKPRSDVDRPVPVDVVST